MSKQLMYSRRVPCFKGHEAPSKRAPEAEWRACGTQRRRAPAPTLLNYRRKQTSARRTPASTSIIRSYRSSRPRFTTSPTRQCSRTGQSTSIINILRIISSRWCLLLGSTLSSKTCNNEILRMCAVRRLSCSTRGGKDLETRSRGSPPSRWSAAGS